MKQKSSLDIAKFLCAILVLIIHADPFAGPFEGLIKSGCKALSFGFRNLVCIIAVPFFFSTSGYLLSQKLNSLADAGAKKAYMWKYLKRLFVIYLVWSAVYFPFVVVDWVQEGFSFMMILDYIKEFVFDGSFSTIWFLPALMSAAALYYLLREKLSSKVVFGIGCGVYVVTLLLSSYYFTITKRIPFLYQLGEAYHGFFDSVKNGVLFGLPFVALGALLQEHPIKITRWTAFAGAGFSYALLAGEVLIYKTLEGTRGFDTLAGLIPLIAFALTFTLSFDVKPSKLCMTLRKYSMLIFLCQRIPITIIDMLFGETFFKTIGIINFATVTAVTFLISYGIMKLSEKFPVLKKIY